jgi:phospholipid/cholesterol/gamma-HCH transport system substrate-binding protein
MRGTAIRLGLFVAGCLAFTVYLAFTIGNIQISHLFGRNTYQLSATFDDVTGLLPNDNVKVAGVVVGKVTGIKVDDGRARVTFQVRNATRLPIDTSAAIRWRNLLGQRYVYLYPGTASTTMQGGGHIATTRSVVDLGELFNRLGPIVQAIDPSKVNTFLDSITAALDGNETKLRQTLDDLATLTAGLATRDDAITRLIGNLDTVAGTITQRDAEIRTVLDNLVALSTTFSQNTNVLDSAVTDLGDFSNNLDVLLANNRTQIDRILANLTTLSKTIQAKLPQIDSTLVNLPATATRLFNASRYGEWLNQTIPCGVVGRTADGHFASPVTPCNPALTGESNGNAVSTGGAGPTVLASGSSAISRLITGGAQ